jgi:hypothetical protein
VEPKSSKKQENAIKLANQQFLVSYFKPASEKHLIKKVSE